MAYSANHKDKYPFNKTVEDAYGAFAAYYDTPYLSMRNAIWRLAEHHHYQMNFTHYYGLSYDFVHPLEQGHRLVADMVLFSMQRAFIDLYVSPWSIWDDEEVAAALPKPMYHGARVTLGVHGYIKHVMFKRVCLPGQTLLTASLARAGTCCVRLDRYAIQLNMRCVAYACMCQPLPACGCTSSSLRPYQHLDLQTLTACPAGNWEEVNRLCTHGKAFSSVVTQSKGWRMVNEGDEYKPKYGYVTHQVSYSATY
eukprot:GHRQ01014469.1.p1 GENE.GHRQ01014469.1~~GHRQ01014469.1.p1  ORF type:complete len:253 (-),score=35.51 GHRQ01014469.1:196-954(-)